MRINTTQIILILILSSLLAYGIFFGDRSVPVHSTDLQAHVFGGVFLAVVSYLALLTFGKQASDGFLRLLRKFWVGFSAYGIALILVIAGMPFALALSGNQGLVFYLDRIAMVILAVGTVAGYLIANRWLK
jgi:hypothetical protein